MTQQTLFNEGSFIKETKDVINANFTELYNSLNGSQYFKLLPRTASKVAKIRAGVTSGTNGIDGQFKVGILGDSTTAGAGAGSGGTNNITGARAKNIVVQLSNILNSSGLTSRHSTFMGDQFTVTPYGNNTSYPSYDPRLSFAGGASIVGNANFRSAGGIYFRLGVGASMTFDPAIAWDTAVIYTADDAAGSATFSLGNASSITNSSITNVATSISTLKQQISTITKATTTLIFTRSSGNPDFRGAWLYDSTVPAVNIFGLGAYGLKLSTEAAGNGTSCPYTTAIASDLYDLLFVDMSINDMGAGLTSVDTYMTALTSVVNAQRATGGDAVVCTPNCCDPTAVPLYASYLSAIRSYCNTNSIALVDNWDQQGSYTTTNTNGLMYDTIHPNAAGYSDKAQRFAKVILNA